MRIVYINIPYTYMYSIYLLYACIGEGEVKIIDWASNFINDKNESVVICGSDSDILLQSIILSEITNITVFQKGNEYSNAFCNITTVIDNLAIAANLTKNYQKPLKLSGKLSENKGKLSGKSNPNLTGNLSGNLTVEISQQEETAVYTPPIPSYILQAREAYMNTIKQTQMNIIHSSRNSNLNTPPIINNNTSTTTTSTANKTPSNTTTATNNTVHISHSQVAAVTPPQHPSAADGIDQEHEPYLSSLPASFRLDILILFVIQG